MFQAVYLLALEGENMLYSLGNTRIKTRESERVKPKPNEKLNSRNEVKRMLLTNSSRNR